MTQQADDLVQLTSPVHKANPTGCLSVSSWLAQSDWRQGRGIFGGLVLAAMIRAVEGEPIRAGHQLRTLTATICGPVLPDERSTIEVSLLREGSQTSTFEVVLSQSSGVCCHLVVMYGSDRKVGLAWQDLEPPTLGDWRRVKALSMKGLAPEFTQHFEVRPVTPVPFAASTNPSKAGYCAEGWLRLKVPGSERDAAYLALLADMWWPAFLVKESAPRPIGTVSFSFQMLSDWSGLELDAPLYCRAHTVTSAGGYAIEYRELWGSDGRLMGLNQQTFAIIR